MIATNDTTTTNTRTTAVLTGRLELARVLNWLGLSAALAVSAVLNLWNLAQNGYSNLYYSVAVQSMTQSFSNFFFGSYDAGGYITVDKPPVALWVQAISARIFGFSSLAVLLPQALLGVASVALLYFLVRRLFGPLAGFVAALALALTPIAVAVERTNNTDTMLMFTLLLAAWALTLATEKGQFKFLALGLALVGVGFNVKMLAAFIILPAFYLLYFVGAPVPWFKRILHLGLGSVVLFAVALSWPLTVDKLIPADARPWVGGSQSNSVLDLALNYNGVGRVTGNEGTGMGGAGGRGGFGGNAPQGFGGPNNFPNPGGANPFGNGGAGATPNGGAGGTRGFGGGRGFGNGGATQPGANGSTQAATTDSNPLGSFLGNLWNNIIGTGTSTQQQQGGRSGAGPFGAGGMFGAGEAGANRLFTGQLAGLWSWFIPVALFGLLATVISLRRKFPLEPRGQALILWGGWLLTYGVVFSIAEGIFHPYYLVMLAPGAAALAGIGLSSLVAAYKHGGWRVALLPIALLVTAVWQLRIVSGYAAWSSWLTPLLVGGTVVAALSLAATRFSQVAWRRVAPGLVGVGLVALFLAPTAWAITPVMAGPANASLPTAGPEALTNYDPNSWTHTEDANSALIQYLEANTQGYFYLLAVTNSQQASSLTLVSGKPVLATGGFMGSDPALTVAKLQELIASKMVRYVAGLGQSGRGGFGGGGSASSVNSWVTANCSAVPASDYGGAGGLGGFGGSFGFGNSQIYDCAPAQQTNPL